jgi:pimeloyl-ACP methyl ester carboxylesterase
VEPQEDGFVHDAEAVLRQQRLNLLACFTHHSIPQVGDDSVVIGRDQTVPRLNASEFSVHWVAEIRKQQGRAIAREIARTLCIRNSPNWCFAGAFDNPDYVDVVIHSYRHRPGLADGYSPYEHVERRLAALPAITVPAITLDGKSDGVVPANAGRSSASRFSGSRSHRVVEDAGHNLPEESPRQFADAVWELASAKRCH